MAPVTPTIGTIHQAIAATAVLLSLASGITGRY